MSGIDAIIKPSESLSRSMNMVKNNVDLNIFSATNYMLSQQPQCYVYMYNISNIDFPVSRPPIIKSASIQGLPKVEITEEKLKAEKKLKYPLIYKAKDGKKAALVMCLPQPVLLPKGSVDSSEVDFVPTDARRFMMDIINPENLGLNQDVVLDPSKVISQGNNLGARGVFWSLNGPGASAYTVDGVEGKEAPTEEEIMAAYARLEKFYTKCLEDARTVETSRPADLGSFLNQFHHAAAEYFGEEHSWHGKRSKPVDCPICGERMRQGVAYHKTEDGGLCISDWAKVVAAGVRTRAQAYDATGDDKFAPKIQKPAGTISPGSSDV